MIETNEAGVSEAAKRESATRSEPITVEEYARDALAVVLRTWSPPNV